MPVRRLNHAVLYVNGLDREVDFYTRTLGFEVRLQIPGRAAFLRSPGSANDHDLGLFEVGTGHADGRPSVGLPIFQRNSSACSKQRRAEARSPCSAWQRPWWCRMKFVCSSMP